MVITGDSGIVGMTTREIEEAILGKGVFEGVVSGKLKSVVVARIASSMISIKELEPVATIKSAVEVARRVDGI